MVGVLSKSDWLLFHPWWQYLFQKGAVSAYQKGGEWVFRMETWGCMGPLPTSHCAVLLFNSGRSTVLLFNGGRSEQKWLASFPSLVAVPVSEECRERLSKVLDIHKDGSLSVLIAY